ncbi:MAG TPA: primary-amine oxidase [Hyphomicrobiaceae bacterium]|nr:primary-amine oxidase [Hyphomicrobiaceae bacterium]
MTAARDDLSASQSDGHQCCSATASASSARHPLDPLDGSELARAAGILNEAFGRTEQLRFERIEVLEPEKAFLHTWKPGDAFERQARFAIFRRGRLGVTDGILSLDQGRVISSRELPTARPMIMLEEFLEVETAVKADPRFIAACKRRGIDDVSMVCVDPWSAGSFDIPGEEGRRISHTFSWLRTQPHSAYYAHPIEGVNAVVDVDTMEVLRVDDHYEGREPLAVPMTRNEYDARFKERFSPAGKALDIVQPEGPSFTVEGRRIRWMGWDVLVGFNSREGLILHDIGHSVDGVRRKIMHRASLAEMVVPYGSPERSHYRKNVFDIGEYGLGKLANSLKLGCDCLGAIHYMDAWVNGIDGTPVKIENAICIHEEDQGLGWKHWDWRTDVAEVRRLRRLVISSISTVGNYEYASYWYLYQHGGIEFEVKATGVINTVGCEPGNPSKYGSEVMPGVMGQIHQHLFCARLDMEVDGPKNSVVECNVVVPPVGPENPHGNVFYEEQTLLATEKAARRRVDPSTMRYWKVVNPGKRNAVGKPTAYKLEPTHAVTTFTHPEGPSGRRGGFIYNHLWVTPFSPDERYPAGDYVNQSEGGLGLPQWTEADRPVENTDIVVWHVFGLHHPVRLEDFPVQPVVMCGFKLMPSGFFDKNPMIDDAPTRNAASCCV